MQPTRREFLKAIGAGAALSFGPAAPSFLDRLALAGETPRDGGRILVAVQLTGGNDGLNTVVPFEDDRYARSRPTLRLRADRVLKIDPSTGFHPEMEALRKLYDEGLLSVIHGVGHAGSSRDHDEAMREWQTARPGAAGCQTGCLGRAADLASRSGSSNAPAAFVGEIDQPFGLNAESAVVPALGSLGECAIRWPGGEAGKEEHLRRMARLAGIEGSRSKNPLLERLRRSAAAALEMGRRIEAAAGSEITSGVTSGPTFQLARTLIAVERLIRAETGIRIYLVELGGGGIGGFDSHANQAANHGALLRQLSESLAAFLGELKRDGLLERVLLITFSEFGRTVAENGRRGTDHGAAQPIFLAGGKVRGGLVGPQPSLEDLDQGGQKPHTDFRRVYATVLGPWLGFDARAILGGEHEPLDVLQVR